MNMLFIIICMQNCCNRESSWFKKKIKLFVVNHKKFTRVQFNKLQQYLKRLLQCLRSLSFGIPRYGSEWQQGAISRRIQLTLVKHHRLYSTVCWTGSTSWTVESMRRVLGVFFATRTSTISIIDAGKKAHAPVRRRLLLRRGIGALFLLLSFRDSAFFFPPSLVKPMRFFPIFLGYFPREKSSSPDRNFQDPRPYVSYADYLSSDKITISCIECPDYCFFPPSSFPHSRSLVKTIWRKATTTC